VIIVFSGYGLRVTRFAIRVITSKHLPGQPRVTRNS